jgi:hypothetical protein
MKLTQFGRMRRRIKRELEEARRVRALAMLQSGQLFAQSMAYVNVIKQSVITVKMLHAWRKERLGQLPDPPEQEYTAEPLMKKENPLP